MTEFFERGAKVVLRNYHPTLGVERVSPARVVEDGEERTVLYISAGSTYRQVVWMGAAPPRPDQVAKFEDGVWTRYSMLRIMYPDVPYSVWPMWTATDGSFARWYVNIESPFERRPFGFDTVDYELDIVVAPDMSWRWKDEEELEQLVEVGVFTAEQAVEFREFGLDAIRMLELREPPFNEPWPDWRREPEWGPLEMPEDAGLLELGGTILPPGSGGS